MDYETLDQLKFPKNMKKIGPREGGVYDKPVCIRDLTIQDRFEIGNFRSPEYFLCKKEFALYNVLEMLFIPYKHLCSKDKRIIWKVVLDNQDGKIVKELLFLEHDVLKLFSV